jgi:predicted amidohydrolase YtcJ
MSSAATFVCRAAVIALFILAMTGAAAPAQQPADLILVKGRVATQDRAQPAASAVAIKDGKFVAVSADKDVLKHRGDRTTVIDAKGRTVVPGLIDSHLHAIRAGRGTACRP